MITFKALFGELLFFTIPLLILFFITSGIAALPRNAGRLLGRSLGLAYLSTLVAGTAAFVVAAVLVPMLTSPGSATSATGQACWRASTDKVPTLDASAGCGGDCTQWMGSSLRIVSFIAQYSSGVQQNSIDRSTRAHRACKASHSASGALWSDVLGGLVFDPLPDLDRHRVLALFQDVSHQPYGTRQDADAAHNFPW